MIKYFVRTTKERTLDNSFSQIEYELLVDTEHKPVKSFIEQLEIISDYDAILLEDDIQLCRNFKERVEAVINQYPDKIINFFTDPTHYFPTSEGQVFYFNQCTYYPKGIAKKLAEEMRKIEEEFPGKYQYDVIESKALNKLGIKHLKYRPCLVQHLDNGSLIGNKSYSRRTIYFIDYLDDASINYSQANLPKNRITLKYRLRRQFLKKK